MEESVAGGKCEDIVMASATVTVWVDSEELRDH
jgi:hypothetical protein